MEILRQPRPEEIKKHEKTPRKSLPFMARVSLASFALVALAACAKQEDYPDDGYRERAIHHEVINPLNQDRYASFTFSNRETQERNVVDFHHLKSSPEKFERVVANLDNSQKTILDMQQENVPLGDIEFQHSTITFLDTKTLNVDTLQINRVKPTTDKAPEFTAYSLFLGKNEPSHVGTLIFSDRPASWDKRKRGEEFVALQQGTFGYIETSERFANSYMNKVSKLMSELESKDFEDTRVDQAVWKEGEEKNHIRTMKGVLRGVPYTIRSKSGGDKIPGYHLNDDLFEWSEILGQDGRKIAKATTEHFRGTIDGDAVVYKFTVLNAGEEKTVLELKRTYKNKSETQTSKGTGTTAGVSSSGNVVVGWTSIDLQTPVNYQNENTMLYSFGEREGNLSETEKEENMRKASAILVLLGGASILDGFNFQDSEIEWGQSSERVIDAAQRKQFKPDMGFWLELPVNSTTEGQEEAFQLLTNS